MRTFRDSRPRFGQDPFLYTLHTGARLLIQSEDDRRIKIYDWDRPEAPGITVWESRDEQEVWAPELHYIDNNFYIYYSFSDGDNRNHRNHVLVSTTHNPLGPYHRIGRIGEDIWGIDLTVAYINGQHYAVWSGWPHNYAEFPQNLYIAPMYSPTELGERILLAIPERQYEGEILEGPQFCNETNNLYYSANKSWETSYCTGLLQLCGDNPLNPSHWAKFPIPTHTNFGHAQPIGNGELIGHTKLSPLPGWSDRAIEIRRV